MPMTQATKDWRKAERKAQAKNEKATAGIPLFADQVELTSAKAEYWNYRLKIWGEGGGGHEAAYLWGVDQKVMLWLARQVAKRHMSPEDFALADRPGWHQAGDIMWFWRDVLTGRRRIVLSYWRHVYGCSHGTFEGKDFITEKHVDVGEDRVWPPAGWQAPLTREQFEELTRITEPLDHPGAIDPLRDNRPAPPSAGKGETPGSVCHERA